jgi:hypothetical protein
VRASRLKAETQVQSSSLKSIDHSHGDESSHTCVASRYTQSTTVQHDMYFPPLHPKTSNFMLSQVLYKFSLWHPFNAIQDCAYRRGVSFVRWRYYSANGVRGCMQGDPLLTTSLQQCRTRDYPKVFSSPPDFPNLPVQL